VGKVSRGGRGRGPAVAIQDCENQSVDLSPQSNRPLFPLPACLDTCVSWIQYCPAIGFLVDILIALVVASRYLSSKDCSLIGTSLEQDGNRSFREAGPGCGIFGCPDHRNRGYVLGRTSIPNLTRSKRSIFPLNPPFHPQLPQNSIPMRTVRDLLMLCMESRYSTMRRLGGNPACQSLGQRGISRCILCCM
jgi:hypothetical protein